MFSRLIEKTLIRAVKSFPGVVLTGPRQSGKTTLLKKLFPNYHYVTFESPDTLLDAKSDPRGFLDSRLGGCIIDEAQNYPEIFSYIQGYIDRYQKAGQFILSGSQNFLLAEKISQTLAGRVAIFELLPLTYSEYLSNEMPPKKLWQFLYGGSYPRPYYENLDIKLWYQSYISTYLERDVRSLINVRDLTKFQLFLRLCAGYHGQLLNLNSIAVDCGVSHTTINHWLSILEASYILFRLQPYYKNFKKRLVKTSKLYFYDTAIVSMLLGIDSSEHLERHSSRGAIFEGFVISEVIKLYKAKGENPRIYFWRDHAGLEVDLILEKGEEILAFEIKSSATFMPEHTRALSKWQNISGMNSENCFIIYAGEDRQSFKGMSILRWHDIDAFFTTES